MKAIRLLGLAAALTVLTAVAGRHAAAQQRVTGWLHWRGPNQNGVSLETNLPDAWTPGGANHLWDLDLAGRGTPVIANDRVYAFGYQGEGPDLQEVLVCLDAATGRQRWERRFNDFNSDIIYDRYSIGSPTVDAETGNVYVLTSPGIFACFTADGDPVWEHSMMEDFGRLTFPNGRTGAPAIDGDLVIVHAITSNWGLEGPARDRFYAFDKRTGGLVWSSTPGVAPKDSSFAAPYFDWANGKRVFYATTGCGNLVCVNARTGAPIWRYQVSAGGMNSSVARYRDLVVAIHDAENLDSSGLGRMLAIRVGKEPAAGQPAPLVLTREDEAWRNDLGMFTSSPVIVRDRIYQMTATGMLCAVNAETGNVLWRQRLGPDQLHASPLYADGKLYIPLNNGMFYIIQPTDAGPQELSSVQLEGNCLGAPAVWKGRIYVHTTSKLYCFGGQGDGTLPPPAPQAAAPRPGPPASLQIVPAEVVLQPGQSAAFTVRGIDANGFVTGEYRPRQITWARYVPPTARVRAELDADFNRNGRLVAAGDAQPSAGAFEATVGELKGYIRGRILSGLPEQEDFESFPITVDHATEAGVKFAYPPLPWIGARFKFEVRELDGNKVLAKTLDNNLFQRATIFLGASDLRNYTVTADVMADGSRRNQSTVGLVNQRYTVALSGNSQELEVSSNHERVKVAVPFAWTPRQWYTLKTRVDVGADGAGVIRARVWKKDDPEPEAWTLEVPHHHAHRQGSPGIFGFAPQSQYRVYIDNISITPNG